MVPGDTLFTNNTCLRVYNSTPVQGLQRLQNLFLHHLSQYTFACAHGQKSAGIFGPTSSKIIRVRTVSVFCFEKHGQPHWFLAINSENMLQACYGNTWTSFDRQGGRRRGNTFKRVVEVLFENGN